MVKQDVYEYSKFSDFFRGAAESRGLRGGMKSVLAKAMQINPAYVSRILAGHAQISLEQAERLATYFRMGRDEKRYLICLLQEERAGSAALKKFFRDERIELQNRRRDVKDRIPLSQELQREDQAIYYSAWYYQAVHVLVSIPRFRDLESIAEYLELTVATVRDVIWFLERTGIIQRLPNRWAAGMTHLHLERKSPFLRQHHTNWRLRAVHTLDRNSDLEVRYSGTFSLSETDANMIKEKLLRNLNEYLETVKSSAEEQAYSLCFDFFEV